MSEIKAVIFDIDGTLVDSRVRTFKRLTETLPALGYDLPPPEAIADYYHMSEPDILRAIAQPETEEDFQKILDTANEVDRYTDLLITSPNLRTIIRTLRRHYKLGSATNADRIVIDEVRNAKDENKEPLNIGAHIDVWVSAEDGFRPKPEPDMLLAVAEALEVEPEESLYVGDTSKTDVEAALNANMKSIQIKRRGENPDPRADRYITCIEELPLAVSSLSIVTHGMRTYKH